MENLLGALGTQLDPAIIGPLVLSWSGRAVAALIIFLIGRWVAKALMAWFGRAVAGAEMDETLSRFLSSLIYIVLMIFVVLTALSALGVNTTNFLAILGAAGLAVGLALKDSLSNFAAGVMTCSSDPSSQGTSSRPRGSPGPCRASGFSTPY